MNILKTTLINIKSNKQLFFASVGTITIALSILGLFLFVYINLNSVLSYWNDQVQLIVYLDDEIPYERKHDIADALCMIVYFNFKVTTHIFDKFRYFPKV